MKKRERLIYFLNLFLVRNFVGNFQIAKNRSLKKEFTSKKWKSRGSKEELALKEFIFSEYEKLYQRFSWNKDKECPIIPVVHGTGTKRKN